MTLSLRLRIVLSLGVLAGCGDGCGKPAPTQPAATEQAAKALAAPTGPRLYVSNEDSGDVSVIDVASERELGRVQVGKRPRALKLSADQKLLFVALTGSPKAGPDTPEKDLPPADHGADGVAVIDTDTMRVLKKLESGADPEQFALSVDDARVYVTNEEDARVSVVSAATGKIVDSVPVSGEPEGIAVHPHGPVIYVTSETENRVDVVDLSTKASIAHAPTGLRPRTVLVSPDGARVFVSNELGGTVTVIEGQHNAVIATVQLAQGARPMGLALSQDGARLYVSNGRGKTVAEVDVASAKVTRTFEDVGTRPWGIALGPDGNKLYTANGPSNDVSVIDLATGKVARRIAVGRVPWGVVLSTRVAASSAH